MNDKIDPRRRTFLSRGLAGMGALMLSGCYDLSQKEWVQKTLRSAETLTKSAQRALAGSYALAPEYEKADIAPSFRANGTLDPGTDSYKALAGNGFRDYQLEVSGLVEHPLSLSLVELRKLPARTQITRHDCVEGWSCIGQWMGVQLWRVLAMAKPKDNARYAMFFCMDPMGDADYGDDLRDAPYYYESLDLIEATHPQTILAYELNGKALAIEHGAPIRVRAERQLGYKQAKYVERIELVENFDHVQGGKGGYWEDQGYNWWGGI